MTKDVFFFKFFLNVKIALLTNVVTAEIARKTSWTIFFCLSFLTAEFNFVQTLGIYTIFTGLNIEKGLDFTAAEKGSFEFLSSIQKSLRFLLRVKFRKGA